MINPVQSSINRFSVEESKMNQLKNQTQIPDSKMNANGFQEALNESLQGKISSASVITKPNIKEEIKVDPYRKKLFNASVEFESIFVKMMLNQMKKSIDKSGFIEGGYAEEIFEDFLYDEYAKKISENESLGIAEELYKTLSKALPAIDLKG